MNQITAQQQKLAPGARVELFMLDLLPIEVNVQYLFSNSQGVSFGGNPYAYVPVEVTGIEKNASGEMPTPRLSLPNTSKFASALITQHNDLVGAELTRVVTYEKFLDGRPGADATAIREMDVFKIEQKLNLNKIFAQWELRVLADTGDRGIPGRVAMKDVCSFIYRRYVGGQFVPSKVRPCPYTHPSLFFTKDGEPTNDPAQDKCSNRLETGCLAREAGWPEGILQFGGFPGLSRYRA